MKIDKKYFISVVLIFCTSLLHSKELEKNLEQKVYNPKIDTQNFVSEVTNPYFSLPNGRKWIYEGNAEGEKERIQVEVTNREKFVMGIKMTVVRDRVWVDGELEEDTFDWFAQDKDGNVWYFGEQVDNYEDGKIVNHDGSWEAGIDGAKPGLIMKANPNVGDSYVQEYLKGEAEDMGEVLGINQTVKIKLKKYSNCLLVKDWNPLEANSSEHKFYSKEVGFLILERVVGNEDYYVELVEIFNP